MFLIDFSLNSALILNVPKILSTLDFALLYKLSKFTQSEYSFSLNGIDYSVREIFLSGLLTISPPPSTEFL